MLHKKLWEYWKKFGKILGKIQTSIILSVIYYLIVSPIGIIKNLLTKKHHGKSYWIKISESEQSLEKAAEQF